MKQLLATTLALLAATVTVACSSVQVFAVTNDQNVGQALEIAPPVLDIKADPGQKIDTQITLRDVSASALIVSGSVDDFTANGEDGVPKILLNQDEPIPNSIKTWVAPLKELTLKPKQLQNLPVSIQVPKNAAPGGYYGVVRFTVATPEMKETGVSLSASLGALIFIRVNGDAKESLAMDSFFASSDGKNKAGLFESSPITFIVRAKNDGNVYERPTGQIGVTDAFGNMIANVNVNLEQRAILPQSTRKFAPELNESTIGNRFLFGPYTAKLTMNYGNKQNVTSTTTFWVIPWRIIGLALVALVVLVIGSIIGIRRYNERLVGKSRGSRRR